MTDTARPSHQVDDKPNGAFEDVLSSLLAMPDEADEETVSHQTLLNVAQGEDDVPAASDQNSSANVSGPDSQLLVGSVTGGVPDDMKTQDQTDPGIRLAVQSGPGSTHTGAVLGSNFNTVLTADGEPDPIGHANPSRSTGDPSKSNVPNHIAAAHSSNAVALDEIDPQEIEELRRGRELASSQPRPSDLLGSASVLSAKLVAESNITSMKVPQRTLQMQTLDSSIGVDEVLLTDPKIRLESDGDTAFAKPATGLAVPNVPMVDLPRNTTGLLPEVAMSEHRSLTSVSELIVEETTIGPRPTEGPGTASLPAPAAQASVKPVVMQIVQLASQLGQQAVEISLNPEELGKLRLSLTSVEGALTLSISADRSDTLDLLRRHADDLGRQFSDLGYDDIEFQFHGGKNDAQSSQPETLTDEEIRAVAKNEHALEPPARVLTVTQTGLDLRL